MAFLHLWQVLLEICLHAARDLGSGRSGSNSEEGGKICLHTCDEMLTGGILSQASVIQLHKAVGQPSSSPDHLTLSKSVSLRSKEFSAQAL
jgi:hypothetical protein